MSYANIREILGTMVGKTVGDVTQHGEEDYDPESETGAFIRLMFTDGSVLHLPVGDEAVVFTDATLDVEENEI